MLIRSRVLTSACLMGSLLICNGCATANVVIPDSLRSPCESTVDVSTAQTVGDLGKAIVQGDADLRVCEARKSAVVSIAEARNRSWWALWR